MHKPTERVVSILNEIRYSEDGLTVKDISTRTNIPMSTLSPIIKTLVASKFLEQQDNKYILGLELFKIANSYVNTSNALTIIKDYMKNIVNECNEICQLGIYEKSGYVFYLAKVEPTQSIKIISNVGTKIAANASSLGKALLSKFNESEIKEIFKDGMKKYTKNTIISVEKLIKEIEKFKNIGYYEEIGEVSEDIRCTSVPIELNNKVVAALSISIPIFRADEERIKLVKDTLLKYKPRMEASLIGFENELMNL